VELTGIRKVKWAEKSLCVSQESYAASASEAFRWHKRETGVRIRDPGFFTANALTNPSMDSLVRRLTKRCVASAGQAS
jgi:hypothetical protein